MKGCYKFARNSKGFTLVELMIVVAVVAIIAAVALPSYQNHITKTRRSDGQAKLLEVMNQLERYYTTNNSYVTDLTLLNGYDSSPVESENGFYGITAAACGTGIGACVELTATAKNGQESDGNLVLDSVGRKTPAEKW